jgi:hypothetical protein
MGAANHMFLNLIDSYLAPKFNSSWAALVVTGNNLLLVDSIGSSVNID